MIDRRIFLSNGRVAHDSLKGQVDGVTFVPGELMQVGKPVAGLFAKPQGGMDCELMYGAHFLELERDPRTGYSFGCSVMDRYVGYIKTDDLAPVSTANYKVSRLNTHIYPEPNIKTVPLMTLPMGAHLDVISVNDRFGQLVAGGFVPEKAIVPLNTNADDFVSVAEIFLGVAYLWGGDSFQGIDCSGLVQASLRACGQACPRDTDMQQAEVGVEFGGNVPLQRGDLIFWKGHTGIMVDAENLLHANAYHMRVTLEPLEDVALRIKQTEGLDITCRRRL
jgi:cell wall-associated NlpC family hydrolase